MTYQELVHLMSLLWMREISVDDFIEFADELPGEIEITEKLEDILSDVWHRNLSADEGVDELTDLYDFPVA